MFNGDIKFKGISSKAYPLTVTTPPQITHPEKIVDKYSIPGRNGNLLGEVVSYGDAQITVSIALVASNTFTDGVSGYTETYREVRQWLEGRGRLILGDAPDAFYEVSQVDIVTDDRTILRYGNLQAVFSVYPMEYLFSGETEISGGTVKNPGSTSYPLYKITGNGNGVLTVNGKTMSYTVNGTLYIDTQKWIAYDGQGQNMNPQLTGNYMNLKLVPGNNTVSASVGTLAIKPRWGINLS